MKSLLPIIIIFIALNILVLSCEEFLPSREETPVQLFETIFQSADGKSSKTFTRDPVNIHTPHPPPIEYHLQLINRTDETLQGLADSINGSIEVWLDGDPSVGQTFLLSRKNEFPPIGVPSQIDSELVTLDPGDTFYIEIEWFHENEDGIKMWDYLGMDNGDMRRVGINAFAIIQLFPGTPYIVTKILKINTTYFKLS